MYSCTYAQQGGKPKIALANQAWPINKYRIVIKTENQVVVFTCWYRLKAEKVSSVCGNLLLLIFYINPARYKV